MDETTLQIAIYILIAVFSVLPRLLKRLKKKKADESPASAPSSPGPLVLLDDDTIVPMDEPVIGANEQAQLLEAAGKLTARASDLMMSCRNLGGATENLEFTISNGVIRPSQGIKQHLERRSAEEDGLFFDEALSVRGKLARLDDLAALLEKMVFERNRVDLKDLYRALDDVAQSALEPYLIHAARYGIPLTTTEAVSVIGESSQGVLQLLADQSIAAVSVQKEHRENAAAWALMASDLGTDIFFSVTGLADEVMSHLGINRRLPSNLLMGGDRAALMAAFNVWLSQIFGDLLATVQMGPQFLKSLLATHERDYLKDSSSERAYVYCYETEETSALPLAIRVRVAMDTLGYLGLEMEDDLVRRASDVTSTLKHVLIVDEAGNRMEASNAVIANTGKRVVRSLLSGAYPALAGFSLLEIDDLAYVNRDDSSILELERALSAGEARRANPLAIVRAAAESIFATASSERRVSKAAMDSIALKAELPSSVATAGVGAPKGIRASLKSRDEIAKGIIAGAALSGRITLGRLMRGRRV